MTYIYHKHHRSQDYAAQKSQWIIPNDAEMLCYQRALAENWKAKDTYWSLHVVESKVWQLGKSPNPDAHPLHIAKFVGEDGGDWHGYPVAPWLSSKDKPTTQILMAWLEVGLISLPVLAKIKRGKRCIL